MSLDQNTSISRNRTLCLYRLEVLYQKLGLLLKVHDISLLEQEKSSIKVVLDILGTLLELRAERLDTELAEELV